MSAKDITEEALVYAQQGEALLHQAGITDASTVNDPAKIAVAIASGALTGIGLAAQLVTPVASALSFCPPCAAAVVAYGAAGMAIIGAITGFFSSISFKPRYSQGQKDLEAQGEKLSATITAILLTVPEPSRSQLAQIAWDAMGRGQPQPDQWGGGWPIFLPAATGFYTQGPPPVVNAAIYALQGPWTGIQGYTGPGFIGSTSMKGMAAAMQAIDARMKALASTAATDPLGTAAAMGIVVPAGSQAQPSDVLPGGDPPTSFFTPRRVAVGVGLGVLGWFGFKATQRKGRS